MPPPIDSGSVPSTIPRWYGRSQPVELPGELQLLAQRRRVDPYAHRAELVAAPGDRVPDQDVAVEAVGRPAVGRPSWA